MADPDPDIVSNLAARIADGDDVAWPDAATPGETGDAQLLDQFKAIALVAAAHRASWAEDDAADRGVPGTWAGLSIVEKIGEGRFGAVYRAVDPRLQRQVALKLLHAPASSDQAAPLAVINEARLLARIHHPNVVTIHGAECIDGRVGIWTEFVDGQTLEAMLQEHGPLAPADVAAIGVDVCHALAVMHAAGLVHRDVKAQNIMRDASGRVVLVDFGTVHDAARLAGVAAPAGTPLYMAPELFDGGQPSVATDIYAVAVLLYRLLTGTYPVDGGSTNEIKAAHAKGRGVSLQDSRAGMPAALASAIERGLAPNPKDRFADVHQFAGALRPRRRRSLGWLTAGLAAAAVVTLSIWAWSPARSPSDVPVLLCRDCIVNGPMSVAADGRTAVVDDYDSGDLLVHDLATNSVRRLQAKSGDWNDSRDYAAAPVVSRDGRLVAYRWVTKNQADAELRIMPLRGGSRPAAAALAAVAIFPRDWLPNDKAILVTREHAAGWELEWVSVDDRAVRPIKSFPPSQGDPVLSARVSPDGRQIVYGRAASETQSHLFLIDADGTHERPLVTSAAANVEPLWTADGTQVLFSSDIGGEVSLWSIGLAPTATPVLARQNLVRHTALALTSEGRYVYSVDLPSIPRTFVTAVPTSPQEPTRQLGEIIGESPAWSPDGQHLAVIRQPVTDKSMLVIRPTENQLERSYPHGELRAQALWADDNSLFVMARASQRTWSMYRVNRKTGEFADALEPSNSTARSLVAALSADGQTLYVGGRDADDGDGRTNRVIAIDLSTKEEKPIVPLPRSRLLIGGGYLGLAASPAGPFVAVLTAIDGQGLIRVVDVERRKSRDLGPPFPAHSAFGKIAWTRDDQIWYGESMPSEIGHPGWRIMRVAAAGGVPFVVIPRINGQMVGEARFAVSPDSSQIAWTAQRGYRQEVGPRSEVWSTNLRSDPGRPR